MSWTSIFFPGSPPPNGAEITSSPPAVIIYDFDTAYFGANITYNEIPALSVFKATPWGSNIGPSILDNTIIAPVTDCVPSGCSGSGGSVRPTTGMLYPRRQC